MTAMRIRVGVDVGTNSVGCCALTVDEAGVPMRILSCLSLIHDSGIGEDGQKTASSRVACCVGAANASSNWTPFWKDGDIRSLIPPPKRTLTLYGECVRSSHKRFFRMKPASMPSQWYFVTSHGTEGGATRMPTLSLF